MAKSLPLRPKKSKLNRLTAPSDILDAGVFAIEAAITLLMALLNIAVLTVLYGHTVQGRTL